MNYFLWNFEGLDLSAAHKHCYSSLIVNEVKVKVLCVSANYDTFSVLPVTCHLFWNVLM